MTDSLYTTIFMLVWFTGAAIFFVWFSWRERQDQKRREQRWQEKEERRREAQRQREQHLKERHALILRTRQQRNYSCFAAMFELRILNSSLIIGKADHSTLNIQHLKFFIPHSTFNTDILGFPPVTSSMGAFIS